MHRSSTTLAEHYAFLLYLLAQSVLVIALVQPLAQTLGIPFHGAIEGLLWLGVFTGYVLWAGRVFYREALWRVTWKTVASYVAVLVIASSLGPAARGVYLLATGRPVRSPPDRQTGRCCGP